MDPRHKAESEYKSADAEVEKSRLDLQNLETRAKTEIRSLISNLKNTWESLEIARLRVQLAESTVEATEEGFNKGTVEFRDLEDIRSQLTEARLRLLQGEYSYQSYLLDLAAALNIDWKTLAGSIH